MTTTDVARLVPGEQTGGGATFVRSQASITLGPDHEPLWLRRYVQPYPGRWAAMIVGDDVPPPDPGTVTGLTFFGADPRRGRVGRAGDAGAGSPAGRDIRS